MGLKTFHILFIISSVTLALGMAVWGVHNYSMTGNTTNLSLGIASLVGVAILVKYANWFLKKLEKIEA